LAKDAILLDKTSAFSWHTGITTRIIISGKKRRKHLKKPIKNEMARNDTNPARPFG